MKNLLLVLLSFCLFCCKKKETVEPVQQTALRVVESNPCIDTIFGNKSVIITQTICLDSNSLKSSTFKVFVDNTLIQSFNILKTPTVESVGGTMAGLTVNNKIDGYISIYSIPNKPIGVWGYKVIYNSSKDTLRGITYFHRRYYVK